MKKYLFLIVLASSICSSFSQDFGDYIKENAIETTRFNETSDSIYQKIKDKELIMIGEMHGTNEPAIFVENLSRLIAKKEGSVSVGIEIPEEEINLNQYEASDSVLLKTTFFSKENIDGRNGKAWFRLVLHCLKDSSINLFFFDNVQGSENRDSIMYESIISEKLNHPNNKIITLSGNIHNRLIQYNGENTMGSFCFADTINFNSDSVCSIIHTYSEGTMMNNTGNGLKLTTKDFEESVYSSSTKKLNYILFFKASNEYPYNGVYYTRKVSSSEVLSQ